MSGKQPRAFRPVSLSNLLACPAVLGAICLFLALPLVSSTPDAGKKAAAPFVHRVWRTEDGLPQNSVNAIVQTKDGYLWLGTFDGLARFDGVRFKVFQPWNTPGMKNARITYLLESKDGRLWAGTEGGGLLCVRDGLFTTYTAQAAGANFVASLQEAEDGGLWLQTDMGLARFEDGRFLMHKTSEGLIKVEGVRYWVLADGALVPWKVPGIAEHPLPTQLAGVRATYEDREGNLWAGTARGLHCFTSAAVTALTADNGLPVEDSWCVLESRDGGFGVGTNGGGLSRFKGAIFTPYTNQYGAVGRTVWALREDRMGNLWVGADDGLHRLRDGAVTTWTAKDGLADATVRSLYEDRSANLWVGTLGGGVQVMRDGKFVVAYTVRDGLSSNTVRTIHEDREGSFWFATDGGVSCMKEGRFTTYTTKDGLSDDFVRAIHEDEDGALWFGTYNNGLNRFKGGKIKAITTQDGLFDHTVSQILEDDRGNFWMSGNNGIFRVPRKELNDFADGRIQRVQCIPYGTADGMKSAECNGGSQPAGCRSSDGRLWFPTQGGVAMIDPERLPQPNPVPPPVLIEEAVADGHTLEVLADIRLPAGTQRLKLLYTALSFSNPARVLFRYKLEGYDKEWVDAGTRREATYTNLEPGRYQFRVIACNNDGVWNEEGASWSFKVDPFFHQTRLFLILCVFGCAAIAWSAYRLIRHQFKMRNAILAERNRLAREIHDTVAQGLSGVVLQMESAERILPSRPEEARAQIARACGFARETLKDTRLAISALRPAPLERIGLAGAVRVLGVSLARDTGVELSVAVTGLPRSLSAAQEDDLWRIAQEAITNAIRHGECHHIQVNMEYRWRRFALAVSDDGAGFQPQAPDNQERESSGHPGYGLQGMRERAQSHGWRLAVTSRPGQGTEVRVEVPLRGWPWK